MSSSSGLKGKPNKKPALCKYNSWRQYVPPKCWLTFSKLHGIISKKIEFLTATAVGTSNPIQLQSIYPSTSSISLRNGQE
jgi:hypothetical protein